MVNAVLIVNCLNNDLAHQFSYGGLKGSKSDVNPKKIKLSFNQMQCAKLAVVKLHGNITCIFLIQLKDFL